MRNWHELYGAAACLSTRRGTSPLDSGDPSWDRLEFTAQQPGGLGVGAVAQLVRQAQGSSTASVVCSAVIGTSFSLTTTSCSFSSAPIDFDTYAYYVVVILSRTSTTQTVRATDIRIFDN